MISDPDPELGGAMQLMGTIKTLVDPENMVKSVSAQQRHAMSAFI